MAIYQTELQKAVTIQLAKLDYYEKKINGLSIYLDDCINMHYYNGKIAVCEKNLKNLAVKCKIDVFDMVQQVKPHNI